jgi:hypothetical protein
MNPFLKVDVLMMRKKLLRDCSAQSVVELAIVMFIILLLALGVFEFGRAIHAKNIIINMAREGANLASRTSEDPQHIMNALASTSEPLKMTSHGMIFITKVRGTLESGVKKIRVVEQYRWDNHPRTFPNSRVYVCPHNRWRNDKCDLPDPNPEVVYDALHLNPGDLEDGQVAYTAEVFYDYKVVFSRIIKYSPEMYSITIF